MPIASYLLCTTKPAAKGFTKCKALLHFYFFLFFLSWYPADTWRVSQEEEKNRKKNAGSWVLKNGMPIICKGKKYTGEQTGSNPSWDDGKFEPKLLVLIVIIAQNTTAKKHESPQNRRWGQLTGEKTMVQSLYLKIVVSLLHQELFYKTLLQVQVTLPYWPRASFVLGYSVDRRHVQQNWR
jgi:hypothetical protein